MTTITDGEFAQFQRFIYDAAGITLPNTKKALVGGRLAKRLAAHKLATYGEYLRLLSNGRVPGELQTAVDLLTTNETYFFREPKHFEFLRKQVAGARKAGSPFRVWSAAGSTGEEAYSIAMVLEDCIPGQWEIMGSDISTRVVHRARNKAAGRNALGIIMTGMGDDGARGLKEMRDAGSSTIAQDEASCVVFGMPKEAIRCGGAERILALEALPQAIMQA